MSHHVFAVFALAVLAAGCRPVAPAGWSPGGSGGMVGEGGAGGHPGGAGGAPGGAGGGGGGPGGSGGMVEDPPCPDPENEPLCWALGEGAWTTAPGLSFVPEVAIAAGAKPERIPATALAWTECGPGCTSASTALFDRDDEHAWVDSLAVYQGDAGPMPLAMVTNQITERGRRFRVSRTVRLDDGATVAALRCIESDDDEYVRCMYWGNHPLHTALFAYRDREQEGGFDTLATYQPSVGRFVFRQPWSTDFETSGVLCDFDVVRGEEGPVPLCYWGGGVYMLADRDSVARTRIFEAPSSVLEFAAEGTGAAWLSGPYPGPWTWHAWTLGGEVTSVPVATSGALEPVHVGLGATRTVIALRDGPATAETDFGFLPHRLYWARRDRAAGDDRLDEPLLGGESLRIAKLVATDDYAAAIIEQGGLDVRQRALLVVRRSDAFGRIVRPLGGTWPLALAVSGDTLWVTDPREIGGPTQLYRYDLSQLEAL